MLDIDTSFLNEIDEIIPDTEVPEKAEATENVEDAEVNKNEYIIKKITVKDILTKVGIAEPHIALGIDPSQNGSGFAFLNTHQGYELTLASASLTFDEKDEDPMKYYNMQKEFKQKLLEFIKQVNNGAEVVFDYIIIEDTILRHNPQIYKRLVLINNVIDMLIGEGVLKTKRFIRINNEAWKKELRSYRLETHKKYKKDKLEIEDTLYLLEFDYVVENRSKAEAWKKRENYQDKCDAVGLLIAGATMIEKEKTNQTEAVKTKRKKNKLTYEVLKITEEVESQLLQENYIEIKCSSPSRQIEEVIKNIQRENTEVQKYFLRFKSLGNWGIAEGLFKPSTEEECYLIIKGGT